MTSCSGNTGCRNRGPKPPNGISFSTLRSRRGYNIDESRFQREPFSGAGLYTCMGVRSWSIAWRARTDHHYRYICNSICIRAPDCGGTISIGPRFPAAPGWNVSIVAPHYSVYQLSNRVRTRHEMARIELALGSMDRSSFCYVALYRLGVP